MKVQSNYSRQNLICLHFLTPPQNGFTILHYAAMGGAQGAFEYFLSKGDAALKDVDVKTPSGMTPFHVAASRGHLKLMEYLLEKVCDYYNKE